MSGKVPVRIKICGLRIPEDVVCVNRVVPDFAGFIFVPGRKRYIAPEAAEKLRQQLNPFIEPVGVFADAGTEMILGYLEICRVRTVQLHGSEDDDAVRDLRERTHGHVRIIKAFRVDTEADLEAAERSSADIVLLDHGIGGTGETFDWSLIRNFRRPFFLAGGLTAANVGEAIRLADPSAVDASSSLETDGHKDPEKVAAFVQAVRQA